MNPFNDRSTSSKHVGILMGTICADWQYSSLCWVVKRIQLSWAQGHICCLILFVIVLLLSVQLALGLQSWCSFYSGTPTAIGHSFYTLLEAQLYLVPTVWILAWRAFDLFFSPQHFFGCHVTICVTTHLLHRNLCDVMLACSGTFSYVSALPCW